MAVDALPSLVQSALSQVRDKVHPVVPPWLLGGNAKAVKVPPLLPLAHPLGVEALQPRTLQ